MPGKSLDLSRNSTRIAFIAALLWIASLGFIALAAFKGSTLVEMRGYGILLTGWLGMVYGVGFAWLANVFFVWALIRLRGGRKPALALSWAAILISMETFRLQEFLGDEGGGMAQLFGYGWGAFLWFAALLVLGMAAAARNLESRPALQSDEVAVVASLVPSRISIGLLAISLVAMTVGTTLISRSQRTVVAEAERAHFDKVIIKRGAVCRTADVVARGGTRLEGPLEVTRGDQDAYLLRVEDLLAWGVPSVTEDGFTYSFRDPTHRSTVVIAAQSEPASALLSVRTTWHEETVSVLFLQFPQMVATTAILLKSRAGQALIDAKWRRPLGQRYRPTFHPHPSQHQPPRTLLLSAVLDAEGHRFAPAFESRSNNLHFELTPSDVQVLGRYGSEITNNGQGCPAVVTIFNRHKLGSRLEEEHPLLAKAVVSRTHVNTPAEFLRIGDVYLELRPEHRVTTSIACDGDAVYIVTALSGQERRDQIEIEMRSLSDPSALQWAGNATVDRPSELEAGVTQIHAQQVTRNTEGMALVLAYLRAQSSEASLVQMSLPMPESR